MGKKKIPANSKQSNPQVPPAPQPWQAHFKQLPNKTAMKTARVLIPLSLYMPYHTDESFAAIVDFVITKSGLTPSNVTFLLGDNPQANNFAINRPGANPDSKELRDEADQKGDEWLAENQVAVARLKESGIRFIRWHTIYNDPAFQAYKAQVVALKQEDSPTGNQLQQSIAETRDIVLARFEEREENHQFKDPQRAKEMGDRFVTEECALFAFLALNKDHGYHYIAYPSELPAAVATTKAILVDPHVLAKNRLQWLRIGIKHPRPDQTIAPVPRIVEIAENETRQEDVQNDNDSGFYEVSDKGRSSKSSISSLSTSPESSSGSDDDDSNILKAKKIFKHIILATANATADGLEITGQLPKEQRTTILYNVLQEMLDEMAKTEKLGHSPPHPNSLKSQYLPVVQSS